MHTSAKMLYKRAYAAHEELYRALLMLQKDVKDEVDETELADASFCLRECSDLMDDVRKEMDKTKKRTIYAAVLVWIKKQMHIENGEPIRTMYCTATPDIKMAAKFPTKKVQDGWTELMVWLNIPEWVYTREIVRPHFPGMVNLCTELTQQGKELPPGVDPDNKQPQYDLKMRKTKTPIA